MGYRVLPTVAIVIAATFLAGAAAPPTSPLAVRASDPTLRWGPCPPVFPGKCQIAVLQGDPSKPNADVLLKVAGGYLLPRHRHSSAERMVLIEGRLQVRYDDAAAAVLRPGSYAYGPAGLPHEARCFGTAQCVLFIAFEGPVDAEAVPPRP